MVEPQFVVLAVAGSSPVDHPTSDTEVLSWDHHSFRMARGGVCEFSQITFRSSRMVILNSAIGWCIRICEKRGAKISLSSFCAPPHKTRLFVVSFCVSNWV